jgi:predicted XRE-type DNA-binding protein
MRKTMADLVETRPGSNVFAGSGNVLADIGLPDAEELHAKMRMIVTISRTLEARELSRKDSAKLLTTTQKKVRLIHRYAIDDFSVEQLMRFANALQYEVVIELRPRAQSCDESHGTDVHAA